MRLGEAAMRLRGGWDEVGGGYNEVRRRLRCSLAPTLVASGARIRNVNFMGSGRAAVRNAEEISWDR